MILALNINVYADVRLYSIVVGTPRGWPKIVSSLFVNYDILIGTCNTDIVNMDLPHISQKTLVCDIRDKSAKDMSVVEGVLFNITEIANETFAHLVKDNSDTVTMFYKCDPGVRSYIDASLNGADAFHVEISNDKGINENRAPSISAEVVTGARSLLRMLSTDGEQCPEWGLRLVERCKRPPCTYSF